MDSIKEDIHTELRRLRLDKHHVYNTLLRIIDAIPQEASPAPVEKVEEAPTPVEEVPVAEEVEEVPPTPAPVPSVTKKTTRKKKTTVSV